MSAPPGGPFRRRGGPRPGGVRPGGGGASRPLRAPGNWILALLLGLVLAYITINTLSTEGPGSRGLPWGTRLPPFAIPLAFADVAPDTDVNLDANRACGVRLPDVINGCELARRGPLAIAFWATPAGVCKRQIDVLDRVRARHPRVQAIAVAIRGKRSDVRRTIRERRWRLPVAYDHDGALTNAIAGAVCPTITFARGDGIVAHTSLGFLEPAELDRLLTRIERPAPRSR